MKISIDGGGLCASPNYKFGNYTFTKNIIQALLKYDKRNQYDIYSFCPMPIELKMSLLWRYKILLPTRLWMKLRVSLEEYIDRKDIFLGLNQAIPMYTHAKVISFSHGLSYYYFPHLYRESYARLSTQLIPMLKNSSYIIVSSKKVKTEMKEAYPWYKHVITIPFGIPSDMERETPNHRNIKKYFLYVGMNHPIKNIRFLIKSFLQFRSRRKFKEYKFFLVGASGIHAPSDGITFIPTVSREILKILYREATACLTGSLYESFNLPVLEALSQNCQVIGLKSAIIPEFTPYVSLVEDKNNFVDVMSSVAEGNAKEIDVKKIVSQFSWKKYVRKLIQLYE